jgi:pimeloyl-ACP methyl ester carboxylesterase
MRVNGIELWFETRGEGPPLLLLHGMGGSSQDWQHFGRDAIAREHRTLAVDARGHGRSTNDRPELTHRQCAADVLALLDALGIARCAAIGLSMGGNTLLHVASLAPERIEAMVLISATPRFGAQARALMRSVSSEGRSEAEWSEMRSRHAHGDAQIRALWGAMRALADSADDVNFAAADLARIRARTLVVYGDRDPLYPVEYGLELYRGIPNASLWVVPGGGHGPIAGENTVEFVRRALTAIRPSSG